MIFLVYGVVYNHDKASEFNRIQEWIAAFTKMNVNVLICHSVYQEQRFLAPDADARKAVLRANHVGDFLPTLSEGATEELPFVPERGTAVENTSLRCEQRRILDQPV